VEADQTAVVSGEVIIYAANGAVVYAGSLLDHTSIPFQHTGIYFVEIPELRYRSKIACF
jgi:hypothetical protein